MITSIICNSTYKILQCIDYIIRTLVLLEFVNLYLKQNNKLYSCSLYSFKGYSVKTDYLKNGRMEVIMFVV